MTSQLKAAEDYRSGIGLIDQFGASGLLDPAMVGMLIAIRRGLFEETNASSARELALIDMAVVAYANAMRLQSMIGNTALIIESEMFGQPTLRAKRKNEYGGRPEDIQGLAVEEHVARLRDQLLPLVERAHRTARYAAAGWVSTRARCAAAAVAAVAASPSPATCTVGKANLMPFSSKAFLIIA